MHSKVTQSQLTQLDMHIQECWNNLLGRPRTLVSVTKQTIEKQAKVLFELTILYRVYAKALDTKVVSDSLDLLVSKERSELRSELKSLEFKEAFTPPKEDLKKSTTDLLVLALSNFLQEHSDVSPKDYELELLLKLLKEVRYDTEHLAKILAQVSSFQALVGSNDCYRERVLSILPELKETRNDTSPGDKQA